MLTQNLVSHKELLRSRSEQIDRVNSQIQDLSTLQKSTLDELHDLKDRVRLREERKAKLQSLQREIQKKRTTASHRPRNETIPPPPQWLDASNTTLFSLTSTPDGQPAPAQQLFAKTTLPPPNILRAHLNACNKNISSLQDHAKHLHSRSTEIEEMYRKVVSLCTGVPEDKVEESLPSLVAAVESETQNVGEQDVGRVRDFLRKVEGGGNGGVLQNVLEVNPTVTALAQAAAAVVAAAR
jgi:DNA repair exonuclease SbcCD ATPase subunit